jgi:alpha-L-rhamnosidase
MMTEIISLKCNGFINNMAVADSSPVFSYLLKSDLESCYQTAYHILVAKSAEDLKITSKLCWDSGITTSPLTHGIEYAGEPLEELSDYYFCFYAYINNSDIPIKSTISQFGTALIHSSNIDASWIGSDTLLRKTFELTKTVISAKIAVTGLGYFELFINGEKIGDDTLSPSYTWYTNRIEYLTYDVTDRITVGCNAIGIVLSGHWKQSPDWSENECYQGGCYYNGSLKAKALLKISYNDGTTDYIRTDNTWSCAKGPVLYSSIYDGECYDANAQQMDFSRGEFNDEDFRSVSELPETGAKMICSSLPLIKHIQEIKPQKISVLSNGDIVVDFGVNIAGRCRIKLNVSKDTKVTLRHAEVLYDDGSINQSNLRWAKARDTYISNGEIAEYEPRFTYHGFRFVQISGITELSAEDIVAIEVRSSVETTGDFECSDDTFNKLHEIMCRTLSNNLHSIPTDCCQRDERQGWMGDGQLSNEATCANFDMQYFYRKWLDDIADCQCNNTGNIPFVTAPAWAGDEALAWTCAYYEIAYCLYRFYDDKQVVKKHYDGLCAYFAYLNTREDENGLLTLRGLCDWLAVEPSEEANIRDALYFRFANVLKELAEAIGKSEDAQKYSRYVKKISLAYHQKYYSPHPFTDKNSGYYGTCYYVGQTANAIPLSFGMTPQKDIARVTEKLIYELTESMGETQLTTGFIGTKALFEALMRIDRNDIAYALLKRDKYPSWGFMLKHGATTVWERWQHRVDNEMNSHCHPPLAAPDVWFYRVAAGIREYFINQEHICEFLINPCFELPLDWVKARQKTPFGELIIKWEKIGNTKHVELTIPANTVARIYFDGKEQLLKNGQYDFKTV